MWAPGQAQQQSAQQWWQMPYGYQYQAQADPSADWAARAALWAQQRAVQEQYQQHQKHIQEQHQQLQPQAPQPSGYDSQGAAGDGPPLPQNDNNYHHQNHDYHDGVRPPLPPDDKKEPPPPGWSEDVPASDANQGVDNMETVAMEDEGTESDVPNFKGYENAGGVLQPPVIQDYHHASSASARMQTFDHNHGFTEPVQHPYGGGVALQQFDYGHGSYDYNRHPVPAQEVTPMLPGAQVFDYSAGNNQYGHDAFHPREHSHRSKPEVMPQAVPDFSSLSEVKKKALPLWIREGLEKMEKEKQKKQELEQKKVSLASSTSSLSSIAGYDHGKVLSPVASPVKEASDEESEEEEAEISKHHHKQHHLHGHHHHHHSSDDESEKEEIQHRHRRHSGSRHSPSPDRSESSDEGFDHRTEAEKQQDMVRTIPEIENCELKANKFLCGSHYSCVLTLIIQACHLLESQCL